MDHLPWHVICVTFGKSHGPSLISNPRTHVETMAPAIGILIVLSIIAALTSPALAFSGDYIWVADATTAGTTDERHSRGEEETHGVASAAFVTRAAQKETGNRHPAVQLRRRGTCFTTIHEPSALPVVGRGARRESAAGRPSSHPHDIPLHVCSLLI